MSSSASPLPSSWTPPTSPYKQEGGADNDDVSRGPRQEQHQQLRGVCLEDWEATRLLGRGDVSFVVEASLRKSTSTTASGGATSPETSSSSRHPSSPRENPLSKTSKEEPQTTLTSSLQPTFALKLQPKTEIVKRRKHSRLRTEQEVLSLQHTDRHPFIVPVHCMFQSKGFVCFVLGLCEEGSLKSLMATAPSHRLPNETSTKRVVAEVICVLEYLHSHDVIYRDLKPENIMVGCNGHLCIADFDLSSTPGSRQRRAALNQARHTSESGTSVFGNYASGDRFMATPPPTFNLGGVAEMPRSGSTTAFENLSISAASSVRGGAGPSSYGSGGPTSYTNNSNINYSAGSVGGGGAAILGQNSYNTNSSLASNMYIGGGTPVRVSAYAASQASASSHADLNVLQRGSGGGTTSAEEYGEMTPTKLHQSSSHYAASMLPQSPTPTTAPQHNRSTSFVGTADYISPEVIADIEPTAAVDMWGLGILIYELTYGITPFAAGSNEDTLRRIECQETIPFPMVPQITPELKKLLQGLLCKDPVKRLTLPQVKQHAWFTGGHSTVDFRTLTADQFGPLYTLLQDRRASGVHATPSHVDLSGVLGVHHYRSGSTGSTGSIGSASAGGGSMNNRRRSSATRRPPSTSIGSSTSGGGGGAVGGASTPPQHSPTQSPLSPASSDIQATIWGVENGSELDLGSAASFSFFETVEPRVVPKARSAEALARILSAGGVSSTGVSAASGIGSADASGKSKRKKTATNSIAEWFKSVDWSCGFKKRVKHIPQGRKKSEESEATANKRGGTPAPMNPPPVAISTSTVAGHQTKSPTRREAESVGFGTTQRTTASHPGRTASPPQSSTNSAIKRRKQPLAEDIAMHDVQPPPAAASRKKRTYSTEDAQELYEVELDKSAGGSDPLSTGTDPGAPDDDGEPTSATKLVHADPTKGIEDNKDGEDTAALPVAGDDGVKESAETQGADGADGGGGGSSRSLSDKALLAHEGGSLILYDDEDDRSPPK